MIVFDPGSMGTGRPSIFVLVMGAVTGACEAAATRGFVQRDA
jgi:hypothetical protein